MSIRVLLVDDEPIDLEWLRRRVANAGSELDLEVAGTANSGFAALSIMETNTIDIILSDIRMPIMIGTEFARRARELQPKVKIVFISGHEDFGYAREAIEVNAYGYLLKPVADDALLRMLEELTQAVMREREQEQLVVEALSLVNEELIVRWLEGKEAITATARQHVQSALAGFWAEGLVCALLEIDDVLWKLGDAEQAEVDQSLQSVWRLIRKVIDETALGKLIIVGTSQAILLSTAPEDKLLSAGDQLLQQVRNETSFTITIGLGTYSFQEEELLRSYSQAREAIRAKWMLGKNRIIRDAPVTSEVESEEVVMEDVVERLLSAILAYDLVAIDDCLLELFVDEKGGSSTDKNEVYDRIVRVTSELHANLQKQNEHLYEILEWESRNPEVLFQFETLPDILSWLRRRFFELSELLYVKRQRQKRKLIDEMTKYVDDNIASKITLKEIAAHLHFSPNYLGHLFKEETGEGFSEFLSRRKMDKVCELLRDPSLKIYEIADRMGYGNIIYFNRQFKNIMDMTPGEYRKLQKI